jgi:hypothetical protein
MVTIFAHHCEEDTLFVIARHELQKQFQTCANIAAPLARNDPGK